MHFPIGKRQYHRMNRARFGQAPGSNPNHLIPDRRSWPNHPDESHERSRPQAATRRYASIDQIPASGGTTSWRPLAQGR